MNTRPVPMKSSLVSPYNPRERVVERLSHGSEPRTLLKTRGQLSRSFTFILTTIDGSHRVNFPTQAAAHTFYNNLRTSSGATSANA